MLRQLPLYVHCIGDNQYCHRIMNANIRCWRSFDDLVVHDVSRGDLSAKISILLYMVVVKETHERHQN